MFYGENQPSKARIFIEMLNTTNLREMLKLRVEVGEFLVKETSSTRNVASLGKTNPNKIKFNEKNTFFSRC